ncbi:hypothetical protein M1146_02580 [Patescibacteria group bacterium]|nr:hypothetical protein [Patescibacteria group bacterium]
MNMKSREFNIEPTSESSRAAQKSPSHPTSHKLLDLGFFELIDKLFKIGL